jgi:PhoPQ-activated pathogenicity-related protein
VTLAVDQGVVVARLDAVPNQPLRLGPGPEEREDALVAHSWDHYLSDPEGLPYASIHLPMMRAVVAAMDLVQTVARKEGVEVRDFVLTGGSKRAWAAWLASIQDARVRAIIPTSADFWNLEANFVHIHRSYAAWPPALKDYEQYRITSRLLAADPALKRCLIAFEDPLGYLDPALDGRFRPRLEIPKFLISASGDDFTVPDSPQFFLGALPGPTAFRALPNQGHGVEPEVLDQAIAPVLRRLLDGRPFPAVTCQWRQEGRLSLASPEQPTRVRLWRAENPAARDFRFHSGIRFTAQDLDADGTGPPWTYTARPPVPTQGWSAQFLEATYPDGLVLTTPVAVWPLRYPDGSPVAYPSFRPE